MVLAKLPQDACCDSVVIIAGWKAACHIYVACPTNRWVVRWILTASSNRVDEIVRSQRMDSNLQNRRARAMRKPTGHRRLRFRWFQPCAIVRRRLEAVDTQAKSLQNQSAEIHPNRLSCFHTKSCSLGPR